MNLDPQRLVGRQASLTTVDGQNLGGRVTGANRDDTDGTWVQLDDGYWVAIAHVVTAWWGAKQP